MKCSPVHSSVQERYCTVVLVGLSKAGVAPLTGQCETDGGRLKEEVYTLANGHADADSSHNHEEEAEDGHEASCHA